MSIDYIFSALDKNDFSKYFAMSKQELASHGAYLFKSDEHPCYPCRVSLTDARVGETVLAISYEHHDENSAYRASGPIFVRQNAETAMIEKNEIPEIITCRSGLHSLRGYSADNLMIAAETVKGADVAAQITRIFEDSQVRYIHAHNAGPGCFNCTIQRA